LKERGWNDADILDAVYHGALMVSTDSSPASSRCSAAIGSVRTAP
jgi:hypothetical protein